MAAARRLCRELQDARESNSKVYRVIKADVSNWEVLVFPEKPPYDNGAFRIQVNIPAEYPFKPPTCRFLTKIYHPNVFDGYYMKLPIISISNWQPRTKLAEVFQSIVDYIDNMEPLFANYSEAQAYERNRDQFLMDMRKNAQ